MGWQTAPVRARVRAFDDYDQSDESNGTQRRLVQWVAGIAMFACLVPGVCAYFASTNEQSAKIQAGIPLLTQPALIADIEKTRTEFAAPIARPAGYFDLFDDVMRTRDRVSRFLSAGGKWEAVAPHLQWAGVNYLTPLTGILNRYNERFGYDAMRRAGASRTLYPDAKRAAVPFDTGRAGSFLIRGYLLSLAFALAFFTAAVMRKEMSPLAECERILLAVLAWPYAFFVYPTRLDVAKQLEHLRRMKSRVGSVLAAFVTFIPAGAIAKSANEGGTNDATSKTLLFGTIPVPELTASTGVMSSKVGNGNGMLLHRGPVTPFDVRATLGDGWSFDITGTRAHAGKSSSDETDYGIFKSGTLWAGTAFTAGLAVNDFGPVHGGIFLAPSFRASGDAGYGVTLSAFGEYDWYASHAHSSAYKIELGAQRSFDLGSGVSFGQAVSLIESAGPYGIRPGVLMRFDSSLKVPLIDQMDGTLSAKEFVPIRAPGRQMETAAGLGISSPLFT